MIIAGGGPGSQKAAECLDRQINEQSEGSCGSPFKLLESVRLGCDERAWIGGQRVRVSPHVPYLLLREAAEQ